MTTRVRPIHECSHPKCDRAATKSIERQNPGGSYERVAIACQAHINWALTSFGVNPAW